MALAISPGSGLGILLLPLLLSDDDDTPGVWNGVGEEEEVVLLVPRSTSRSPLVDDDDDDDSLLLSLFGNTKNPIPNPSPIAAIMANRIANIPLRLLFRVLVDSIDVDD